ncbi:hypothetical protein [Streptomyces sp. NPDC058653]|uniref:hypothetical protein n=1 Tax=Streptomyces sp. NPDC058653 TaxID=3346576 RepID=UPI00365B12C9
MSGRLKTERGEHLPVRLPSRADDLTSLHAFVSGLERDLAAVTAGPTLPWSSSVVEGHVNRIKMIKRQMYGRAGFNLLRKVMLTWPIVPVPGRPAAALPAGPGEGAPVEDGWVRVIVFLRAGQLMLRSGHGSVLTPAFPGLAAAPGRMNGEGVSGR